MGRHVPGSGRNGRARWVVAALATLVLAVGAGAVAVQRGLVDIPYATDLLRPRAAAPQCRATIVRVQTAPAIAPAVRAAVAGEQGRALTDGTCLQVDVQGVTPDQTIARMRTAGAATTQAQLETLPHLWVPDATLWAGRAPKAVGATVVASLATSPVVLASSASVVKALGWPVQGGPTWAEAVTGVRPVAVDLTTDTCGLATVLALRATIPVDKATQDKPFKQAVAGLSLAVDHAASVGAPFDLAATDDPRTPLVPATEQNVLVQRRSGLTALRMVYPKEGSPALDYPLVSVAGGRWSPVVAQAVSATQALLQSAQARAAYVAQGFRSGTGVPTGPDVATSGLRTFPLPSGAPVEALVAAIARLAAPTRLLALIDVSTSMKGEIAPGVTKIGLVGAAAAKALEIFPDRYSVGNWVFASRMQGTKDYLELSPVQRLSTPENGGTHRDELLAELKALPTYLNANGTSIYDTVDAAVTQMRETFDPGAANVIVLLTDGVDTDPKGLTLDQVTARLGADAQGRDVRLVAIGIGRQVDLAALRRLARATKNGDAYIAEKPDDLGRILVEALAARS